MANRDDALDFDRKCLADLGLQMPRCTHKYVDAATTLAHSQGVSTYFIHIKAAQNGHKAIYRTLRRKGWAWDPKRQCWRKVTGPGRGKEKNNGPH